jgi:hypothetical protein
MSIQETRRDQGEALGEFECMNALAAVAKRRFIASSARGQEDGLWGSSPKSARNAPERESELALSAEGRATGKPRHGQVDPHTSVFCRSPVGSTRFAWERCPGGALGGQPGPSWGGTGRPYAPSAGTRVRWITLSIVSRSARPEFPTAQLRDHLNHRGAGGRKAPGAVFYLAATIHGPD